MQFSILLTGENTKTFAIANARMGYMIRIIFVPNVSHSAAMQLSAIWHTYISKAIMANIKSGTDWSDLAEALKSAAHPERIAILHLICNCGCEQVMVKTIYGKLHLEQSITSRHLGIMKKSGLLKREIKDGKIFYKFNKGNLTSQCIRKLLTDKKND